ncbi:MAG TPA: outer membrane beta-barrel protein [Vicinamibacterales bacterium]|nr:outer membrane beta-barrel protein [Vicinamibacterales bacterium]
MRFKSGMVAAAVVASCVAVPRVASADTLITPFVGTTFGGDAKEHRPTFGASVTFVGRSLGLELELGRTSKFFGDSPTSADVTTLTAALVGGADIRGRGFKPYFLTGAGLMRTGVAVSELVNDTSYNNFALFLGGGANVLFSDHVGIRGDLRYFRRLERQSDIGILPIASNFDFWRATIGLQLHF